MPAYKIEFSERIKGDTFPGAELYTTDTLQESLDLFLKYRCIDRDIVIKTIFEIEEEFPHPIFRREGWWADA